MAPSYAFNPTPNRFDIHVMESFRDDQVTRRMRDHLIAQVREGQFDHLLLRRLDGMEDLPIETNEKAAINVIDFHFEPLVLQSMPSAQLAGYFHDVQKTLHVEKIAGLDDSGPLWIDTVHHVCVFSVVHEFAAYLVLQRGYRKLILLHQGQRPEPRLALSARLMQERQGIQWTYIQFHGNWFSSLAKLATPDTAIFYLVDMPREVSRRTAPRRRGPSSLVQLHAIPNISIRMETVSGSGAFARRLGAAHVVLEYPGSGHIRVRPYDATSPVACCPLEDWAFWPLLDVS